jgi:hypothetical protein
VLPAREALMSGFSQSFAIAGALAVLAFVVAVITVPKR